MTKLLINILCLPVRPHDRSWAFLVYYGNFLMDTTEFAWISENKPLLFGRFYVILLWLIAMR